MTRTFAILLGLWASAAQADPATVTDVSAERSGESWHFAVTLRHGDTGWEDYADGWRIETPGGDILGTRDLLHPHVQEQPFTRSLTGVVIPANVTEVMIRASTNVEGWGEATLGPIPLR